MFAVYSSYLVMLYAGILAIGGFLHWIFFFVSLSQSDVACCEIIDLCACCMRRSQCKQVYFTFIYFILHLWHLEPPQILLGTVADLISRLHMQYTLTLKEIYCISQNELLAISYCIVQEMASGQQLLPRFNTVNKWKVSDNKRTLCCLIKMQS